MPGNRAQMLGRADTAERQWHALCGRIMMLFMRCISTQRVKMAVLTEYGGNISIGNQVAAVDQIRMAKLLLIV